MTVFIDVDGVLCDFAGPFRACLGDIAGEDLPVNRRYDFTDIATPEQIHEAWHVWDRTPGLVRALPWLPGAKDCLERLRAGDDVVALTAPRYSLHWVKERFAWLQSAGFTKETVVFTHAKHRLRGMEHILLDDKIENVDAWGANAGLVSQPWNDGPCRSWRAPLETWVERRERLLESMR